MDVAEIQERNRQFLEQQSRFNYQTKPEPVEAVQLTDQNIDEVGKAFDLPVCVCPSSHRKFLNVRRYGNNYNAYEGHWIVRRRSGEINGLPDRTFKFIYEPIDG